MKLSIIIPVYNSYGFLKDLACQIAHQLTDETELIIIDDGSTDELKTDHSAFVHHNKENLGVSAARNVGIKLAKGEYITFVDADDWVSDDFVEAILGAIKTDKSRHNIYWFKAKTEDGKVNHHITPVWGKAYNKKIFKEIEFDEHLKAGEDIEFLEEVKNAGRTCKMVDEAIYEYRWSVNPNSLSKRYNRGDLS